MAEIQLSASELAILDELFIWDQSNEDTATIDEIRSLLYSNGVTLSERDTARAIGFLRQRDLVTRIESGGNVTWYITTKGKSHFYDHQKSSSIPLQTSQAGVSHSLVAGPAGTMPMGTTPVGVGIRNAPAADRYVSVRDNQPSFKELVDALTRVKNQFASDHVKFANDPDHLALFKGEIAEQLTSEADATLSQIKAGVVRAQQLTLGLWPMLEKAAICFAVYEGLHLAISDALTALTKIAQFFGLM